MTDTTIIIGGEEYSICGFRYDSDGDPIIKMRCADNGALIEIKHLKEG